MSIPCACLSIALSHGHRQLLLKLLGAAGEFSDQGCFTTTGFTGYETYRSLTGQSLLHKGVKVGEFRLTYDKNLFLFIIDPPIHLFFR